MGAAAELTFPPKTTALWSAAGALMIGLAGPENSWPIIVMTIIATGELLVDCWRRDELKRRPTD